MRGCCWRVSREPLAARLAKKVLVLAPETGGIVPRITTASFQGIAEQMFQLEHGVRPRIASDAVLRERLRAAAASAVSRAFPSDSCCPSGPMSSTPGV